MGWILHVDAYAYIYICMGMTTYAGEIDKRSEVRNEGAFKVIQGIQHVFRLVYGSQSTKEFRLGFTSMISPPVRILLCAIEGFAYKPRYWGGNVGWNTDPEHHKKKTTTIETFPAYICIITLYIKYVTGYIMEILSPKNVASCNFCASMPINIRNIIFGYGAVIKHI